MPDYWGRILIERNAGLAEPAEFDYLLQGPGGRAGVLGFGPGVSPPSPRRQFNRTLDLSALQRAADAVIAGDWEQAGTAKDRVEELLLLGTSVGGARPKAVVEDEDGLWIAKFGRNDDRWNHPRIEHGLLALARACGRFGCYANKANLLSGPGLFCLNRRRRKRCSSGLPASCATAGLKMCLARLTC